MAEIKDPKGKHLLGEAVRLFVQHGGAGAAVTDFFQSYSQVVATAMNAETATPDDFKAQLTEVVREVFRDVVQELTPTTKPRRQTGNKKRVTVELNGARTTLTIRQDLLDSARSTLGQQKTVKSLIQSLAEKAPAGTGNRSAWVESELHNHILLTKAEQSARSRLSH